MRKIIIAIVILTALAGAVYYTLPKVYESKNTENTISSEESVNKDSLGSYSDEFITLEIPNSWDYSDQYAKNPPPEITPCGAWWFSKEVIKCIFLDNGKTENQNPPYSIGIGIFETKVSAINWCKNDDFNALTGCTIVSETSERQLVSARTSDNSTPKNDYLLLSEDGKLIIFSDHTGDSEQFKNIVNSTKLN